MNQLVGQRFGRLAVLSAVGGKHTTCACRCDCGAEKTVRASSLTAGYTKSCGCWQREGVVERSTKHGLCYSPEYVAWRSMRQRCEWPGHKSYADYGGRGISICARWQVFEHFLADMGARPGPLYSLDRIDFNGNYEPANCRWADKGQQARNRRPRPRMTVEQARARDTEQARERRRRLATQGA